MLKAEFPLSPGIPTEEEVMEALKPSTYDDDDYSEEMEEVQQAQPNYDWNFSNYARGGLPKHFAENRALYQARYGTGHTHLDNIGAALATVGKDPKKMKYEDWASLRYQKRQPISPSLINNMAKSAGFVSGATADMKKFLLHTFKEELAEMIYFMRMAYQRAPSKRLGNRKDHFHVISQQLQGRNEKSLLQAVGQYNTTAEGVFPYTAPDTITKGMINSFNDPEQKVKDKVKMRAFYMAPNSQGSVSPKRFFTVPGKKGKQKRDDWALQFLSYLYNGSDVGFDRTTSRLFIQVVNPEAKKNAKVLLAANANTAYDQGMNKIIKNLILGDTMFVGGSESKFYGGFGTTLGGIREKYANKDEVIRVYDKRKADFLDKRKRAQSKAVWDRRTFRGTSIGSTKGKERRKMISRYNALKRREKEIELLKELPNIPGA